MEYERLKEIVNSSTNIVFFGGAGVSTESNIPDFRSEGGLYTCKSGNSYSPETILSHSFFDREPEEFFRFYKEKMIYEEAIPNDAHIAFSKLEKAGKLKTVITQNIDGLHQAAGSKNVLELHGSVHKNYCVGCGKTYNLEYVLNSSSIVPKCDVCGKIVRPDVVLYEESLDLEVINNAINYIENADVLIVGGTSLVVYPAANLIRYYRGKKLILINKSCTQYDYIANLVINDRIGKVLRNIV